MRTGLIHSLVFSLLTTLSTVTVAASAANSADGGSPLVQEISKKGHTGKTDLNAADAPTLQRELSGVGEAKAKAIVAYRDVNGPFASVDELLEVKGIGKAILDRNRQNLEVN